MSATNFPWPAEPDLNLAAGVFTSLVERASLSVDRGAGEPSVDDGRKVLNLALQRATELANPATITGEDSPDEIYLGGMDGLPYKIPGSSKKGVLVGTKLLEITAPQSASWIQAIRVYIHGRARLEMNSQKPALPGTLKPLPWTDYGHIPIQNKPAVQKPVPGWPDEPPSTGMVASGTFTQMIIDAANHQLRKPGLGDDGLSYEFAANTAFSLAHNRWNNLQVYPPVLTLELIRAWRLAIKNYLTRENPNPPSQTSAPTRAPTPTPTSQTPTPTTAPTPTPTTVPTPTPTTVPTPTPTTVPTPTPTSQTPTPTSQTSIPTSQTQGSGQTVFEQPKVGEEGWMEYLKGLFRGDGKDAFSDDVSTQQEYVNSQRANLRPFLPIAGTDAFDEQDSFESDKLKERNLMMGMVGFNPTGTITNNPFIYGNAVNTGLRFSGELFAMPEVLNGGTLTEGATLYGSYRPTPTNPMDILPPPSTRACRKRYR